MNRLTFLITNTQQTKELKQCVNFQLHIEIHTLAELWISAIMLRALLSS
jgi:hypothetical protein